MIKNILITGGTGFLGSSILKKINKKDYNIIVLVREKSDLFRIEYIKSDVQLFYINEKLDNLDELFKKYNVDTIIHTATEYGRNSAASSIFMTNLIFPIKLIEEGVKNKLRYFINSDSFFGKKSFADYSYLSEYTNSKRYFFEYLFNAQQKVKVINMRLEHVFGEFDSKDKFVTNILNQLLDNNKEVLLTDGLQKRDFIYVEDAADAYLNVISNIENIKNFTEFEIGTGTSIPVREFVEVLFEISESKSELKFGAVATRTGEIQNSFADLFELSKIGWKQKYDLRSALVKMIQTKKK